MKRLAAAVALVLLAGLTFATAPSHAQRGADQERAAAGITLVLTAPSGDASTGSIHLAPLVSPEMIGVRGSF